MRIAQVIAGGRDGGAELFFERLTVALRGAGDDVLPVIRRDVGRAGRLRSAGLEPVELGFGGPLDLLTGRRLRAALEVFRPEVVVAWMNRAARFAPRGDWVLAGRLGGYYDLGYYRRCDHVIGNTRGLVDWMVRQGWPVGRAHYLPNFVPDFFGVAPVARAALAVPDDVPLLLGLGRLHAHKGFDVLIRAVARLPGVHAVIAGEGPERGALADLARREGVAGRVRFLGWRDDVGALLAACDVFVCSSRVEPLGNMVLEAFSAGRVVVAAAADGPLEVIDPSRGVLVALEDDAALADAVGALCADAARARMLGAAGRAFYLENHAEAPVVARWRAVLGQLEKI